MRDDHAVLPSTLTPRSQTFPPTDLPTEPQPTDGGVSRAGLAVAAGLVGGSAAFSAYARGQLLEEGAPRVHERVPRGAEEAADEQTSEDEFVELEFAEGEPAADDAVVDQEFSFSEDELGDEVVVEEQELSFSETEAVIDSADALEAAPVDVAEDMLIEPQGDSMVEQAPRLSTADDLTLVEPLDDLEGDEEVDPL